MKKIFLSFPIMFLGVTVFAQKYPEPEFVNEVYYLKKDSMSTLVRLEKSSSKMESKVKGGGFGGSESGYTFEGDKSSVRFSNGSSLSFIYSTGSSASSADGNRTRDSVMRANGVDPSLMESMRGTNDPASTISLYKVESEKSERKILMQKMPGAMSFSKKMQSSDKYTFSVKKIRDGYWELVVDKTLPKGEYAFTMMNMTDMSAATGGGTLIFAFAIDSGK